jgi:1-aminocyclopropane-1-carboxylate deaminase/D-cysteine desulfhydrase-like pyridoxal-dependent ACC family enzyme
MHDVSFEKSTYLMSEIRPLFSEYPDLKDSIPFVELADLPTPVEHKPIVLADSKTINNLWIKRDDKTNSNYGGNKVRKLEYIIADIQRRGIKKVLTFGGIGTNHGVATSLFCQQYGIDCTILLFEQPVTPAVVSNVKLMASFGAKLKYKGSLLNTVLHYYFRRFFGSASTYYLHAGGSNIFGCIGFVNAAFELSNQINLGELDEPDYIYCPVGSSGTLAGLSLGCQLAGLKSKVVGVRVAPSHLGPVPICTPATIMKLARNTYTYLRKNVDTIPEINLNKIELLDSFYGDGYGISTAEAEAAIRCFDSVSINLETTYTAKAAAAAVKCCRENSDKRILYWHTYNSSDISGLMDSTKFDKIPGDLFKNSPISVFPTVLRRPVESASETGLS